MVINSIEIEVERKPIKNLHLAVYPPDGRVHVSAPQTYAKIVDAKKNAAADAIQINLSDDMIGTPIDSKKE